MEDLTEEQIKRLAIFCGLTLKVTPSSNHEGEYWTWYDSDGKEVDFTASLEDLFKRAVPKLRGVELKVVTMERVGNLSGRYCSAQIQLKGSGELIASGIYADPAQALAQAILKAIEGG